LQCTYLGYSLRKKAYILVHHPSGQIFESRDICFDEGSEVEHTRVVIDPSSSDEPAPEDKNPVPEIKDEKHEKRDVLKGNNLTKADSIDSKQVAVDSYGVCASKESNNAMANKVNDSQAEHLFSSTSSQSMDCDDQATTPINNPCSDSISSTSKTPRHTITSPTMAEESVQLTISYSSCLLSVSPPEIHRSLRNCHAPVQDDDARYRHSAYQQKGMKSVPKLAREKMPNEETSQVERKLLGHTGTSVGDETAHTMSLKHDPVSYNDAIAHPDTKFWKRMMAEELEEFVRKELFTVVGKPYDRHIVGCKWIFKRKLGPNGQVERYKACLVAQGFFQVKGIDYNETYAPVTRHGTIQTLLALAARHQWHIHQMDAKAVFLNGDLSEEIYMKVPPGSDTRNSFVWRLNHALYGLKQASREWYKKVCIELESLGFTRSMSDHGVFIKNDNRTLVIVAVYVDDFLIFSSKLDTIQHTKFELSSHFDMKDLGDAKWILQMEVTQSDDRKKVTLSQSQYIEDILERHGMANCHPVKTPMESGLSLPVLTEPEVDVTIYQQLIGSLMYAMVCTHPDISYVVGIVAHHVTAPGHIHMKAVKRIYRYLRGTSDYKLIYYVTGGPNEPVIYSDSDWAGD